MNVDNVIKKSLCVLLVLSFRWAWGFVDGCGTN